jgi:hypothetical protein
MFDIASGKELVDFSTCEGEIRISPDGKAFAIDSSGYVGRERNECITIFDIPPRRPIAHIVLWPLPFASAVILVFWLAARRVRRSQVSDTVFPKQTADWPTL